ncbi:MAG: T9SS type B sorting domain-containing protein, partial [Bacteroidetes bacterium]|nr:T9SS type B sorting domain-containing protein [Bacteroidota bacterium]
RAQQWLGSVHEDVNAQGQNSSGASGYMKASPKGNFLALTIEGKKIFELFSFDNKTGDLGFIATLPAGEPGNVDEPIHAAYGVEFSPSSNYLYGTTRKGGKIYRWDITKNSEQEIRNSLEVINPGMEDIECGAIQLAFNGKIYVCFAGEQYLGVINSPTQPDCRFEQYGASLIDNVEGVGGTAYLGLPNLVSDFSKAAKFYYDNTCQLDTTFFYLSTISGLGGAPSWKIFNADGTNFIGNADVDQTTFRGSFIFKEPGEYIAELEVEQNGVPVIYRREVFIHALPDLNFADTTLLCATQTVMLDAGDGAFYKWSDNLNLLERYRSIASEGLYSVRVTHNNGCVKYDSTQVIENPLPKLEEIISIKAFCGSQNGSITLILEEDISQYYFDWKQFPDSTGNIIRNLGQGVYEVDIISKETACTLNKKITVSETGAPSVEITSSIDGTICPGTEIILSADGAENYMWSFPEGRTDKEIKVTPYSTTTYIVRGYSLDNTGNECSGFAEITIVVYPSQPPVLGSDRSDCVGNEVKLDGGSQYTNWHWSTGETERFISITENIEELILEVEDQNGCILADTIGILFWPVPDVDLGWDRTICQGDPPLRLDAGNAEQYLWNTGDTIRTIEVSEAGKYSVLATNKGCAISDEIIIKVSSPDSLRIDSVKVKDISCFGGENGNLIVFTNKKDHNYEYSLNDGFSWESNNGVFDNLASGIYNAVMIREDSSCTKSWEQEIIIDQPDSLSIDYRLVSPSCNECLDGQIHLDIGGGTPPYDILWSNFKSDKSRIDLGLGLYDVWITDAKNCKHRKTIALDMGHGSASIPNAFTPNADGVNDFWEIRALENYPDAIVAIFDRSGKLVFESSAGYPEPWDGKYNGEYLPLGTYYFVIKLNEILDLVNGSLTIIR